MVAIAFAAASVTTDPMPPSGNGAAATPHRLSGAPRADQPDAGRRVRARFTHTPVGEQPALPTSEPVEGAEGTVSAFADTENPIDSCMDMRLKKNSMQSMPARTGKPSR